ncbi:hypothetical protein [Actinacidiphila bryophytorum]|uniref:hypothetical protein n=1 Tax=Actinacidiphila bryophytorum TaxID=1436133 RepID=UPI002176BF72|nr:hypothetical protein [Actinacidiphila bryophytorum]UWE12924.1 hypothetical protein NYE86_32415 [Actinacidiphila bryophytorum]
MADAKVIPFDEDSRGRRGSGRHRTGRGRTPAPGRAADGVQPPLAAVPEDGAVPQPGIPAQAAGAVRSTRRPGSRPRSRTGSRAATWPRPSGR